MITHNPCYQKLIVNKKSFLFHVFVGVRKRDKDEKSFPPSLLHLFLEAFSSILSGISHRIIRWDDRNCCLWSWKPVPGVCT